MALWSQRHTITSCVVLADLRWEFVIQLQLPPFPLSFPSCWTGAVCIHTQQQVIRQGWGVISLGIAQVVNL